MVLTINIDFFFPEEQLLCILRENGTFLKKFRTWVSHHFRKSYHQGKHHIIWVTDRTHVILLSVAVAFMVILCTGASKWPSHSIFWCSVQFSSVAQSCQTLCDPMDCSTPGFPVLHQLLEFTQTHVRWVSDAIQPSHPLLSLSPAFSLSQHQGLFQCVSSSHQVAKVLEFQLQHQSFQWIFRTDFLRMEWLDLLAVQRTLKSLLQHHSSKASILQCSAFFRSPTLTSIHDYWRNHSFN